MTKLIKFYTDTCTPCKIMKPVVDKLVENHPEIDYEEINCSDGAPDEWAQEIRSVPTFIVIKEGKLNEKVTGITTYECLESLITNE